MWRTRDERARDREALVVDITSDPATRRFQFELRPDSGIEGHVRYWGTSVGVAGDVDVYLNPADEPLCGDETTDTGDGRFVLRGLEAGSYYLRFQAQSGGRELWYPGVDTPENAPDGSACSSPRGERRADARSARSAAPRRETGPVAATGRAA